MLKTMLLPCLLGPLLTSCATTGPTEPEVQIQTKIVDTSCQWGRPIYVDKADVLTDATAKQILSHNLSGAKKCGWKPTN